VGRDRSAGGGTGLLGVSLLGSLPDEVAGLAELFGDDIPYLSSVDVDDLFALVDDLANALIGRSASVSTTKLFISISSSFGPKEVANSEHNGGAKLHGSIVPRLGVLSHV